MRARTWLPVVAALIAAVSTLSACSSGAKSASASTNPAPTLTSAAPRAQTAARTTAAAACHLATGYKPGTALHKMNVDGEARELLVHIPPHPTAGMLLVVDFHGAGSNMQQQDIYSGFDSLADKHGFVVATPNGIDAAIRQWRFVGTNHDVDFATAIVRSLVSHACVNPASAFAVGISSGGAMSVSLACQAASTFAGFGPVAADFYVPQLCGHARRRPIIIFHGTADPVVPYNGGPVATNNGFTVAPAEKSAGDWAKHNGCTGNAIRTRIASRIVRLTWKACAQPVVMYRIEGGGHTWPGSAFKVPRLGTTTTQVSATLEMWKFFTANG